MQGNGANVENVLDVHMRQNENYISYVESVWICTGANIFRKMEGSGANVENVPDVHTRQNENCISYVKSVLICTGVNVMRMHIQSADENFKAK